MMGIRQCCCLSRASMLQLQWNESVIEKGIFSHHARHTTLQSKMDQLGSPHYLFGNEFHIQRLLAMLGRQAMSAIVQDAAW